MERADRFYWEMMSRNWAFISPGEQEKIKKTKILLAGCGLGSNIGVLAVETGFLKFILVDGDKVETSNLNRQTFEETDVGENKALALAEILKRKSPLVEVVAYPEFITPKTAEKFVCSADVVINTVDFDEAMYIINDIACQQGKPVFFPINIGWAHGFCLVFTPQSATLEEVIGERIIDNEMEFFMKLLQNIKGYRWPDYFLRDFRKIMKIREEKGFNPQLGVGAFCVSIVVVDSIVRYALGLPSKVTPEVMTISETFKLPRLDRKLKKHVKV